MGLQGVWVGGRRGAGQPEGETTPQNMSSTDTTEATMRVEMPTPRVSWYVNRGLPVWANRSHARLEKETYHWPAQGGYSRRSHNAATSV